MVFRQITADSFERRLRAEQFFHPFPTICPHFLFPIRHSGLDDRILSLPRCQEIIRRHAKATGLDQRLQLHIGRAADIIPILPDGIALAYIDADKENYSLYYTLLLPKMRPGGILLFDNMLWYGQVPTLDPNPSAFGTQLRRDRDIHAIHDLNQHITDDPRIDNILLPLHDGLMLCRVKES